MIRRPLDVHPTESWWHDPADEPFEILARPRTRSAVSASSERWTDEAVTRLLGVCDGRMSKDIDQLEDEIIALRGVLRRARNHVPEGRLLDEIDALLAPLSTRLGPTESCSHASTEHKTSTPNQR